MVRERRGRLVGGSLGDVCVVEGLRGGGGQWYLIIYWCIIYGVSLALCQTREIWRNLSNLE